MASHIEAGPSSTAPTADEASTASAPPVAASVFQPSTNNAHFAYPKLGSSEGHFRLIEIQPSKDLSGDISCGIRTLALVDAPEYEALSYTWGNPKITKPIRLATLDNSQEATEPEYVPFHVTVNLESALRAFRLPDKKRVIWADAICIDQSNVAERADQVRLMCRIYGGCLRDLLWLGPEDARIVRAMKLIPRLQGCYGAENVSMNSQAGEEVTLSMFSESDWQDFEALCGHGVWKRVWIVQELAFSPEILLVCGQASLPWGHIETMLMENNDAQAIADRLGPITARLTVAINALTTIRLYRISETMAAQIRGFEKTLLSVFLSLLICQATDARDKVYAILNLVPSGNLVDVDYHKSQDYVSVDFAHACIRETGQLRILSYSTAHRVDVSGYIRALGAPFPDLEAESSLATGSRPESQTLEHRKAPERTLPTWVPDLFGPYINVCSGLSAMGLSRYNACGPRRTSLSSHFPRPRSLHSCLMVDGIQLDILDAIKTPSQVGPGETARDRWVRDVRAWAPADASIRNPYPFVMGGKEDKLMAYWRTVVTDRRRDVRLGVEDLDNTDAYLEIHEGRQVLEELLVLAGWRFGTTRLDMYCMLPPQARVGDVVAVLYGAQVPYLLRRVDWEGAETTESEEDPNGDQVMYELVGEAYVHGMMDGLAVFLADVGLPDMIAFRKKVFTIV